MVKEETTRTEYRRQAPNLRERWRERQYAKTEAQAMMGEYLKPLDFTIYLDTFRNGERGSTQANHDVRLVAGIPDGRGMFGLTRARCAVATRGMRRSAGRSRNVRCSCPSSRRAC